MKFLERILDTLLGVKRPLTKQDLEPPRKAVSDLDAIINDKDWYQPKEKKRRSEKP